MTPVAPGAGSVTANDAGRRVTGAGSAAQKVERSRPVRVRDDGQTSRTCPAATAAVIVYGPWPSTRDRTVRHVVPSSET